MNFIDFSSSDIFERKLGVALATRINSLFQAIQKGLGGECQEIYFPFQIGFGVELKLDLIQHFLPILKFSFESTHPSFQVGMIG